MVVKISKVPFEEALNMTGFSKFNLLMFMLCSSVIVAMVFEIYSVSYLVPASVCELDTTSTQQGLMAGLPLIGVITTSHIWGYLADTRGRRKILCVSMTIGFVAGAAAALSPNWIVLSILKFLSSAAVSGSSAIALALLSECTPASRRSTLLLLTTSAFLSCTGIMAILSIPILPMKFAFYIPYLDIHFNSWRLLNLIFCLPCLLNAFGVVCAYESPKYLLSKGEDKKALEILKGIFEMNSGKSGDLYQVSSVVLDEDNASTTSKGFLATLAAQIFPMFKPPLLKNTLLLGFMFILVFTCINSFIVWLPFMVDAFMSSVEKGFTEMTMCEMIRLARNSTQTEENTACTMNRTAMTMVFGISIMLAVLNAVASGVINFIGKRRLFIGIQILSGLAGILINVSSIWPLSAVLFIMLLTDVINFGFLSAFAVDLYPTYVKAKAVCLMVMLGRGSTILGINVLKNLIENNCEAAFYIFGGVTIAGGVIGLLLPADPSLFNQKTKI
ncbi:organic cation/carnitine transporter 7 [Manduca sexta]|uniref:Major facilitator superfamily (MFS) profile domain-containing protein n=1 Tax=Manduca sexta TaxID=7130 RepID=A0A921Z0T3_MANSE|nr:organic cation/carnitine transporter 7 [Manduca sexta]KAG6448217.1 hypothetical protein O3G_MSEX005386 [Manduca sexta]KAG6448218.1 hypothetical protein O3G_MSEX005386 [Manduca sexta]